MLYVSAFAGWFIMKYVVWLIIVYIGSSLIYDNK